MKKIELFKKHKFKHKHILLFLEYISDSEATKFEREMFDRFINNIPHPSIYSLDGHYINNVFKLIKLDDNKLQDLKNWLATANNLKNNGLYLGVDDNWRSPDIYKEEDYLKALECVKILKDTIEPLFEMPLTDDDFIDYLNRENIS